MSYNYLIIGTVIIGIVIIGYYYKDDIFMYYDYKKNEREMQKLASKKIKSKPINIKINNLDEL